MCTSLQRLWSGPAALAGLLAALALAATGCKPSAPAVADGVPTLQLSTTNAIHVGDPVTAEVTIVHPAGAMLWLDDPGLNTNLVVRASDRRTEHLRGGKRERTTFSFELTSFELGDHPVLTGAVYIAQGTVTNAAPLAGATLRVQSVLPSAAVATNAVPPMPGAGTNDLAAAAPEPPKYEPPKEPIVPRAPLPRWLWALPLVALIALLAAWILRRHLLGKNEAPAEPPAPAIPPHLAAFSALQALWAHGHHERGEVEPFYVGLSAIIRRYLEDRFGLRAPERTTEEFIRETAADPRLAPEHRALTLGFLEQADLVKFARHQPGLEDMRTAYGAAERLVRETIPAPTAPEKTNDAAPVKSEGGAA